jgi:hypothetical protein
VLLKQAQAKHCRSSFPFRNFTGMVCTPETPQIDEVLTKFLINLPHFIHLQKIGGAGC